MNAIGVGADCSVIIITRIVFDEAEAIWYSIQQIVFNVHVSIYFIVYINAIHLLFNFGIIKYV